MAAEPNWFFVGAGAATIAGGAGLLGWVLWSVVAGSKVGRWPRAPGVILHAAISESETSTGSFDHRRTLRTWVPAITYEYTVLGRKYEGSAVAVGEVGTSRRSQAEAVVARYPPSAQVNVFYDPSAPSRAFLEAGASSSVSVVGCIAVPAFFIGAVLIAFGFLAMLRPG